MSRSTAFLMRTTVKETGVWSPSETHGYTDPSPHPDLLKSDITRQQSQPKVCEYVRYKQETEGGVPQDYSAQMAYALNQYTKVRHPIRKQLSNFNQLLIMLKGSRTIQIGGSWPIGENMNLLNHMHIRYTTT
ncbi:uncharacterized [Tachysurus ichikawai]